LRILRIFYHELKSHKYPESISQLIRKRIATIQQTAFQEVPEDDVFYAAFAVMRRMRKHEVMQILKTWMNSWSTSHRYHENPRLSCLFGCSSCTDSLTHYVACPAINEVISAMVAHDHPDDSLARLALVDPCKQKLLTVAASYHAYHFVKLGMQAHHVSSNTSVQICARAARRNFAEAFSAAAHASGLRCLSSLLAE
jgi:hypothetical protein